MPTDRAEVITWPDQSRPKLRDSCTTCAKSKVKCTKEKPSCKRCAKRGSACEYAASNRTGRIPASTSTSTSKVGPAAWVAKATAASSPRSHCETVQPLQKHASSSDSDSLDWTPSSLDDISYDNLEMWCTQASPGMPTVQDPTNLDSFFTSLIEFPLLDDLSVKSKSTPLQSIPNSLPVHGGSDALPKLAQGRMTSQSLGQDMLMADAVDFDTPLSQVQPDCCLTTALAILPQLFPKAPMACSLSAGQNYMYASPTIEAVISQNKRITQTISTILECSCSQDEYVASIVALVVLKTLTWYSAAARDGSDSSDPHSPFSPDSHMEEQSRGRFTEQISPQTSHAGSKPVKGGEQGRKAAQLVLSEMHRVQQLVNALAKRLEDIRVRYKNTSHSKNIVNGAAKSSKAGACSIGESAVSALTLDRLEAELRSRVRAVSGETIDILRRN